MVKLSVSIITYNEERDIGRCIASVQSVADEIIVYDSFSTDQTKQICESFPKVRFFEQAFLGYAAQKNVANEQASNDWILSIDADEALSEELKKSILEAKEKGFEGKYRVNRLTNYCGHWVRYGGWYPDSRIRLWNRKHAQWEGTLHELPQFTTEQNEHRLQGDLLHYSYHSIQQHIAQVNKFTDIGAESSHAKGRRVNLFKIVVFPFWKFLKDYFFKRGFLDGYYGFVICTISAHASFVKYIKMKELQKLS